MIQMLSAVPFSPFKWLLVRHRLGCTIFILLTNEIVNSRSAFEAREVEL